MAGTRIPLVAASITVTVLLLFLLALTGHHDFGYSTRKTVTAVVLEASNVSYNIELSAGCKVAHAPLHGDAGSTVFTVSEVCVTRNVNIACAQRVVLLSSNSEPTTKSGVLVHHEVPFRTAILGKAVASGAVDEEMSQTCTVAYVIPKTLAPGLYKVRVCNSGAWQQCSFMTNLIEIRAVENKTHGLRLISPGTVNIINNKTLFLVPPTGFAQFQFDPAAFSRPAPRTTMSDLFRADAVGVLQTDLGNTSTVNVRSSARVVANIDAGTYEFRMSLPTEPGSFQMGLFLQQGDFDWDLFKSSSCTEPGTSSSALCWAELRVMHMAVAVETPTGPVLHSDGVLKINHTATGLQPEVRGWYRQASDPTLLMKFEGLKAIADTGKRVPWMWIPETPLPLGDPVFPVRYFDASEVRRCLAGRWLAFAGDSTMEELAMTVALLTGVPSYNMAWNRVKCTSQSMFLAREFDTDSVNTAGFPNETRISMFWTAGRSACDDFGGIELHTEVPFRKHFAEFHSHVNDRLGRRPTLIVNSGLHDLARRNPGFNLAQYRFNFLNSTVPFFDNLSKNGSLIWKTSNPKTSGYACKGHTDTLNMGEAAVQTLNEVTLAMIRDVSQSHQTTKPPTLPTQAPWRILDEHALLLPFTESEQILHHHCTNLFHMNIRNLGGVFSGCLATANALLSMLCPDTLGI